MKDLFFFIWITSNSISLAGSAGELKYQIASSYCIQNGSKVYLAMSIFLVLALFLHLYLERLAEIVLKFIIIRLTPSAATTALATIGGLFIKHLGIYVSNHLICTCYANNLK